jgi:hypothetical protein
MNAFVPGLLTSGLACISGRGLNMVSLRSGRKPFNAAQSKWRKNQKLSLGRGAQYSNCTLSMRTRKVGATIWNTPSEETAEPPGGYPFGDAWSAVAELPRVVIGAQRPWIACAAASTPAFR